MSFFISVAIFSTLLRPTLFILREAQGYIDGNKRTAVASALIFLEINDVSTTKINPMELYQPMIEVSGGKLDREGLALRMRELFGT